MGGESCTVLRLRLMRKLAMSLIGWDIGREEEKVHGYSYDCFLAVKY